MNGDVLSRFHSDQSRDIPSFLLRDNKTKDINKGKNDKKVRQSMSPILITIKSDGDEDNDVINPNNDEKTNKVSLERSNVNDDNTNDNNEDSTSKKKKDNKDENVENASIDEDDIEKDASQYMTQHTPTDQAVFFPPINPLKPPSSPPPISSSSSSSSSVLSSPSSLNDSNFYSPYSTRYLFMKN